MDVAAIRRYVNDNPDGILIRMVDGTEYPVPHRDWVWFTPTILPHEDKPSRPSNTSFWIAHEGYGKLINALLVKELVPLAAKKNGNGSHGGGRKRKSK